VKCQSLFASHFALLTHLKKKINLQPIFVVISNDSCKINDKYTAHYVILLEVEEINCYELYVSMRYVTRPLARNEARRTSCHPPVSGYLLSGSNEHAGRK